MGNLWGTFVFFTVFVRGEGENGAGVGGVEVNLQTFKSIKTEKGKGGSQF